MKIKIYKAKSLKGNHEVYGFIYQHPNHTRYCMGEYGKIKMETYIIVPEPGDWGLPYTMHPVPVDSSTVEEYKEQDFLLFDEIKSEEEDV